MTPGEFGDAMRAVVNHKSEALVRCLGEALIARQLGCNMPAYVDSLVLWTNRLEELARNNERPRPRRVVIESPYRGNVNANVEYARAALRDSLMRGESPIASALLHTQPGVLRDEIEGERRMGMAAGHAWIACADLVACYCDRGISPGMERGIEKANDAGVRVVYRRIGEDLSERPRMLVTG